MAARPPPVDVTFAGNCAATPDCMPRPAMPHVTSCGVLIVRGDPIDSFLLMKHPNRWDLPKGHVDPGETEVQCALRELYEETAIAAADICFDTSFRFTHHYKVRSARFGSQLTDKTLVIFLGRLLRDIKIRLTEHKSYAWFDWDPPHNIQPQTVNPLLAELERHLQACENTRRT